MFENSALRVCAEFDFQACNIWSLFVDDAMNDWRTGVVNEGFASRFSGAIEVSTEFFKDILSDLFAMVTGPVLEDSQDNDAKSTFIIETVYWWILAIAEVSVGAGLLEGFHF